MPARQEIQVRLFSCKATELASKITNAELFILMESEDIGKGEHNREFDADDLRGITVTKPLRAWNITVDDVLRSLINWGLIDVSPRFRGHYFASTDGDVVKHTFNDFRDFIDWKHTRDPLAGTRDERLNRYRAGVARICAETKREPNSS